METRKQDHGLTLRRTRRCANGHRFTTFEVIASAYRSSATPVAKCLDAALKRIALWKRNREIVKERNTMDRQALAEKWGLHPKRIDAILRQAKATDTRVSGSTDNSKV